MEQLNMMLVETEMDSSFRHCASLVLRVCAELSLFLRNI